MKKAISLLISIVLILSVLSPVSVVAENGPYPAPDGDFDADAGIFETEDYSSILLFSMAEDFGAALYPQDEEYPIPDSVSDVAHYDIETNTLFLSGLKGKDLNLYLYNMGDDFKISLSGYNELCSIASITTSRGGSITITGEGELVLNRNEESFTGGLTIVAEGDNSVLTIDENVMLKAYAYNDGEDYLPSISVIGTTAQVPVVINGILNCGTAEENKYIYDDIATKTVFEIANNATSYYEEGFILEGDNGEKTYFIGYTDYESDGYFLYSLAYDNELGLYTAEAVGDDTALNPEELGLTVAESLPLFDDLNGFYIGNPEERTDFEEGAVIKDIFFGDTSSDMTVCTDENGELLGYIKDELFDEETGESIIKHTVYDLINTEKYGIIAVENSAITDFEGYTPVINYSENRTDIEYTDNVVVNNGGAVTEPAAVTGITINNSLDSVDVAFPAVKNAEFYDVYIFNFETEQWHYSETFTAVSKPKYKLTALVPDQYNAFLFIARNYVGSTQVPVQESIGQIIYREAPIITCQVGASGIKIQWSGNKQALKYRVYRQAEGQTEWTRLTDIKTTSFVDTTAKAGIKYKYAVRTFFGSNDYTGARSTDYFMRVNKTDVKSATNTAATTVKITWGKTAGAQGYRIYRKTANSSWTLLLDSKNPKLTSYVDKTAKCGTTYTYTVKAYNDYFKGTYEPGVSIMALSVPQFNVANKEKGVRIAWSKVKGATKYRIYRKLSGTSKWEKLNDTTALSFTDTTAKAGKKYDYAVRAYGGKYASTYTSKSILRLKNPVVKSAQKTKYGVELNWSKVSGAKTYTVYRKTAKSNWEILGTIKGTVFTDVSARKGVTYIYTIRAVNGEQMSGYYSAAAKVKA